MTAPARFPDFDGYQVIERVRTGPVSDLYQAVQQPLGRRVLIKALSPSILPSSPFAAILEREARVLAALDHPNIPRVLDFERRGDRMWIVLEDFSGQPLDLMLEQGPRSPAFVAALGVELARALAHAHEHGVIHRDVQPRNVVISARGRVKLSSFAVAIDDRLPSAPELLDGADTGRARAYCSPELILGENPGSRSDLFSLGVVLYEALTGRHPFGTAVDRRLSVAIRQDPPAPIGRTAEPVPPAFERAIMRCLEKLASDRFDSARELERVLRAILLGLGHGTTVDVLATEAQDGSALDPPSLRPSVRQPSRVSFAVSLAGLVGISCLMLAGLGAIHLATGQGLLRDGSGPQPSAGAISSATHGYLKVVADPWAHVVVDGQRRETTPFATPLPLRPGSHELRFEHPAAETERRSVRVVPGETVLVDVRMKLKVRPSPLDAGVPVEDAGVDAGPGPSP